MPFAPVAAYVGSVKVDGTTIGGVTEASITDRTNSVEVTSLGDTAVKRFPTLQDIDFKISFVYDPNDAGQDKIFASKLIRMKSMTSTPAGAEFVSNMQIYLDGSVNVSENDRVIVDNESPPILSIETVYDEDGKVYATVIYT